MAHAIRILRAADGSPTALAGFLVREYDPDEHEGIGRLAVTLVPEEALRFENAAEALREYRRISKVRPLRPDGLPNRPMTAYTVEIHSLPERCLH